MRTVYPQTLKPSISSLDSLRFTKPTSLSILGNHDSFYPYNTILQLAYTSAFPILNYTEESAMYSDTHTKKKKKGFSQRKVLSLCCSCPDTGLSNNYVTSKQHFEAS